MTEFTFAIQQLIDGGDWETLAKMLANPRKSEELRAQAALALAETNIPEAGEALLDAIFHDPSQAVRDKAFEALKQLVGSETSRLAVESYGEEPAPLGPAQAVEEDEDDEKYEDESTEGVQWGPGDIVGLTSIISGGNNLPQRIKAVRALGHIAHHDAVDYLAYMALWEEDDALRKAAYQTLQERYGDELDAFLAEQRAAQLAAEGMTEDDVVELDEEESEEDEPVPAQAPVQRSTYQTAVSGDPVVQEVNPTRGFLLALAGAAILALILYLLFFG